MSVSINARKAHRLIPKKTSLSILTAFRKTEGCSDDLECVEWEQFPNSSRFLSVVFNVTNAFGPRRFEHVIDHFALGRYDLWVSVPHVIDHFALGRYDLWVSVPHVIDHFALGRYDLWVSVPHVIDLFAIFRYDLLVVGR